MFPSLFPSTKFGGADDHRSPTPFSFTSYLSNLSSFSWALFLGFGLIMMSCQSEPAPPIPKSEEAPPSISGSSRSEGLIKLTDQQSEELHIQTHLVTRDQFRYELVVPGNVEPSPDHYSEVSAPVNGRIVKMYAHEGEPVSQGDPLLDIESLEFANLAADYMEAIAEEKYLDQQLQRLRPLVEKQISSQRTLDRAEADLSRASARTKAARARLRAVGIQEAQMQEWSEKDVATNPVLRINAPINGTINEHLVSLGQSVNTNDKMLDIINRDQVLVKAYLSPEDAALLQPGDSLHVHTREGPEHGVADVRSVIATLNPALDVTNRAITLNSFVRTVNGWPFVGQQVRVMCQVTSREPTIGIPLNAVQYEGENATVFVKRDETTWEKRFIDIQRMTPNSVIVSSGLSEGDEVAITQVFSLKAVGKFEEFAD
jgi:cobalt-zinc-cadmium efflux system membrane fusion protein